MAWKSETDPPAIDDVASSPSFRGPFSIARPFSPNSCWPMVPWTGLEARVGFWGQALRPESGFGGVSGVLGPTETVLRVPKRTLQLC